MGIWATAHSALAHLPSADLVGLAGWRQRGHPGRDVQQGDCKCGDPAATAAAATAAAVAATAAAATAAAAAAAAALATRNGAAAAPALWSCAARRSAATWRRLAAAVVGHERQGQLQRKGHREGNAATRLGKARPGAHGTKVIARH